MKFTYINKPSIYTSLCTKVDNNLGDTCITNRFVIRKQYENYAKNETTIQKGATADLLSDICTLTAKI